MAEFPYTPLQQYWSVLNTSQALLHATVFPFVFTDSCDGQVFLRSPSQPAIEQFPPFELTGVTANGRLKPSTRLTS